MNDRPHPQSGNKRPSPIAQTGLISSAQLPSAINNQPPAQPFNPQNFVPSSNNKTENNREQSNNNIPNQGISLISQPLAQAGTNPIISKKCGTRYPAEEDNKAFFISVVGGRDAVLGK